LFVAIGVYVVMAMRLCAQTRQGHVERSADHKWQKWHIRGGWNAMNGRPPQIAGGVLVVSSQTASSSAPSAAAAVNATVAKRRMSKRSTDLSCVRRVDWIGECAFYTRNLISKRTDATAAPVVLWGRVRLG